MIAPPPKLWPLWLVAVAVALHAALLWHDDRPGAGDGHDFFILYTAVDHARHGRNPYQHDYIESAIRSFCHVAPGDPTPLEGGFFYPPQMLAVLAPFTTLPWPVAPFAWQVFVTGCVLACGSLAWAAPGTRASRHRRAAILVTIALLCPIAQRTFGLGQTTYLVAAAVSLGHHFLRRGRPLLGAAVWSVVAVKPHLAVPFLILTWPLYGYRTTLRVAAFVVLFTVAGCWATTGSLGTIADFARSVSADARSVGFNRVTSDLIVSWPRLLYATTGYELPSSLSVVLFGYAASAAAFVAALRLRSVKPSPALLLAAAAVISLLCGQAKGYDLPLLVLAAPLVIRLFIRRLWLDLAALLALALVTNVPRGIPLRFAEPLPDRPADLLMSYRAFIILALFVYLLLRPDPRPHAGQIAQPAPAPAPDALDSLPSA